MVRIETQLKQLKPTVKKVIIDYFQNIEKEIGEEFSDDFKDYVVESFEKQYPKNVSEIKKLKFNASYNMDFLMQFSKRQGEQLDRDCKFLIEKIIDELFKLKPETGIGNNLWKYFTRIWQFDQTVTEIFNSDIDSFKKATKLYQFQQFYQSVFEFTLKFLIEFNYQIATNKQDFDKSSKKFVSLYEFNKKRGESPLKRDLINYCIDQNFLKKGTCPFLINSRVRNSIAHSNAYYDEKNDLLVFGKTKMSIEEFKNCFQDVLAINSYILKKYLEKSTFSLPFSDIPKNR